MNESDFETGLRRLVPAAPSAELESRIALALETRLATRPESAPAFAVPRRDSVPARPWRWLLQTAGFAGAGALAGVAAMWYFHGVPPASPQSSALFEPAASAREIVATEEAGTIYGQASESARLVRYTSIERHAWSNPATGAWVQVEMPREDLVALPVSYQ